MNSPNILTERRDLAWIPPSLRLLAALFILWTLFCGVRRILLVAIHSGEDDLWILLIVWLAPHRNPLVVRNVADLGGERPL